MESKLSGGDVHDNFYHYRDLNDSRDYDEEAYNCSHPGCIIRKIRKPDGTLKLRNPHIENMPGDFLYHLGLGTEFQDLVNMFSDVKFVCMGGASQRMKIFADEIVQEIGHKLPVGTTLQDISHLANRFSMYKVGPVISISHGMGLSSIMILLHEIIKLMYHAKVKDPIFFRIGTCGGVGVEGGTVIISNKGVDEMMNEYYELPILGKKVQRPAILDQRLVKELESLVDPKKDDYKTVTGATMCANDFYEGQGRLDGAFCDYTESDKMDYLNELYRYGVRNIEMEAAPFSAITNHAGIRAAIVCVAFLNRLNGDQVTIPKETLNEWQLRPQKLVAAYIKRYLEARGRLG